MFDFDILMSPTRMFFDLAYWGLPVAGIVYLFRKLIRRRLRGASGEKEVGRALASLFEEVLDDVIIPDGRGGLTQIDHVALTGAGLLVVETKNFSGAIFGGEQDAQWTQRLGGKSYRFKNPLRQNHLHVSALQALPLGIPIRGHVVFTDDASFPNGLPKGVSHRRDIRRDLGGLAVGSAAPSEYAIAWERLNSSVRNDKDARRAHLAGVRRKTGGGLRPRTVAVLLVLAAAWVGVRWIRSAPPPTQPVPQITRESPAPAIVPAVPRMEPPRDGVPPRPPQTDGAASPPGIAWSGGRSTTSEACNLATAALLIENTAENRERRDRACMVKHRAGRPASD